MESSGGSVLHQIKSAFKDEVHVSALVRSITARDAVMGMQVNPIHFDGLHDLVTIEKAASEHDSKSGKPHGAVIISCLLLMLII
jgi:hypothetical protein